MLDRPRLQLHCSAADTPQFQGVFSDRVEAFVECWRRFHDRPIPPLHFQVVESPPQHSGLGVGTQLGLSVATALNTFYDLPSGTPELLSRSVERGRRSAVGAYGFHSGGLIIERGKTDDESLSPLDLQVDLPEAWRFLLVRATSAASSVYGKREQEVFAQLSAQPQLEYELESILRNQLAPAAATAQFAAFADSVELYGRRAGSYFAAAQGGAYNGPLLNRLVATMKSLGARGVGQSSWGPTLFSCLANQADADVLAEQLSELSEFGPLEITVSRASRNGAEISVARHQTTPSDH